MMKWRRLKKMSERKPLSNKYRKSLLSYNELIQILSLNTNLSNKAVEKVYKALIEFLTEELKINGKIKLKWFGFLYSDILEGGERKLPTRDGQMVRRYCPPKRKVRFVPSTVLLANLNEEIGVNSFRDNKEKAKKQKLIEPATQLKFEREAAVKNIIEQEGIKQRMGLDPNVDIDDEDLISVEEWEEKE